jgi:hypothetical protein
LLYLPYKKFITFLDQVVEIRVGSLMAPRCEGLGSQSFMLDHNSVVGFYKKRGFKCTPIERIPKTDGLGGEFIRFLAKK